MSEKLKTQDKGERLTDGGSKATRWCGTARKLLLTGGAKEDDNRGGERGRCKGGVWWRDGHEGHSGRGVQGNDRRGGTVFGGACKNYITSKIKGKLSLNEKRGLRVKG